MDPVDHVTLTRQLVDIESTTGNEGEVGAWLADFLRRRGYSVLEQPLEPIGGKPRHNVIGRPVCSITHEPRFSSGTKSRSLSLGAAFTIFTAFPLVQITSLSAFTSALQLM